MEENILMHHILIADDMTGIIMRNVRKCHQTFCNKYHQPFHHGVNVQREISLPKPFFVILPRATSTDDLSGSLTMSATISTKIIREQFCL